MAGNYSTNSLRPHGRYVHKHIGTSIRIEKDRNTACCKYNTFHVSLALLLGFFKDLCINEIRSYTSWIGISLLELTQLDE